MRDIMLSIFALSLLFSYGQTATRNLTNQNYIEVKGVSEMEVIPNEIYIKIIIKEKVPKEGIDLVEMAMIDSLTKIGIDVSKALEIKDMTSNFKRYWLKGGEAITTREYYLLVKSANIAGRVFQSLNTLSISEISIDKIAHSEIEALRDKVRIAAIKAAKKKATGLTGAIGQRIGNAIYIEELTQPNYTTNRTYANVALGNVSYESKLRYKPKQPEIEFEKIELRYTILVRFALVN